MQIHHLIERLVEIEDEYGDDLEVWLEYFDGVAVLVAEATYERQLERVVIEPVP